jgi:hypothetical protein
MLSLVSGWRKSSYSGGNGACVEAATLGGQNGKVGVRDTQLEDSPVLMFPSGAWREFAGRLKAGTGVAR